MTSLWILWSLCGYADTPDSPEDIELPYVQPLSEEARAAQADADRAQLRRSIQRARAVFIAEVLAIRPDPATVDQSFLATVQIQESLKGGVRGVLEVALPLGSGRRTGRAPAVKGYQLLFFLNDSDTLLNSGALYLVEADHIWRNRRDDVFLRPTADREWTDQIDPSTDYIVIPLDEVRETVQELAPTADAAPKRRGWWPFRGKNR